MPNLFSCCRNVRSPKKMNTRKSQAISLTELSELKMNSKESSETMAETTPKIENVINSTAQELEINMVNSKENSETMHDISAKTTPNIEIVIDSTTQEPKSIDINNADVQFSDDNNGQMKLQPGKPEGQPVSSEKEENQRISEMIQISSHPSPKIKAVNVNPSKAVSDITNFLAVPSKRQLTKKESIILLNQLKKHPETRGLLRKNTTRDVTLDDDEFQKLVDGELKRLQDLKLNAPEFTTREKNFSVAPKIKDQEEGWLTTLQEDSSEIEVEQDSPSDTVPNLITRSISTTTGLTNFTCLGQAAYHKFKYSAAQKKIVEDKWPTIYSLIDEENEKVNWEIIEAPSHILPGKTYNFIISVNKSYAMQIGNEVYIPSEILDDGSSLYDVTFTLGFQAKPAVGFKLENAEQDWFSNILRYRVDAEAAMKYREFQEIKDPPF